MKKITLTILLSLITGFMMAQTNTLWGMTSGGGIYGAGVIFRTDSIGNNQTVEYSFLAQNIGKNPTGDLCQASNGKLYGVTDKRGQYNKGVIFEYDTLNNSYTVLFNFNDTLGSYPHGSLVQASNGNLYGMTVYGGVNSCGVIFEYNPSNNAFTKKVDFDGANKGKNPYYGSLVQATSGKLYGMTAYGGVNSCGVIFEYNPSNNAFTKKVDFDGANKGQGPFGSLVQATSGKLYGMTRRGGLNDLGVIFEYNPSTNAFTKKVDFDGINKGHYPYGSLVQASNGKLYGMTSNGGANGKGTLFEYNPANNAFIKKIDFDGTNKGESPQGSLVQANNGKLYGMTTYGGVNSLGTLFEYNLSNNTFTKIVDLDGTNKGHYPSGSLVQATNGKLYGMTTYGGLGGEYGDGIIFSFNPSNDSFIKKIDFNYSPLGNQPYGSLLLTSNGRLYGFTKEGGQYGYGVLFEYNIITHNYTKKIDFDMANNGSTPHGSLMQASNGKLYGMTAQGGTSYRGTIFEFNLSNSTFTKLIDFDWINNGDTPQGTLMQASNGKLYGMTASGGVGNLGMLFEFNPSNNVLTKKVDFDGLNNGQSPHGSLIQASNGKLYGMTPLGGVYNKGVLFEYNPSNNAFTKKIDFDGTNKGKNPRGSLVQASNGKLYGMISSGGVNNKGVIFEYNSSNNAFTKKVDFNGTNIGDAPYGSLVQASIGKLYGMTYMGGQYDQGVIFEYNPITDTLIKKTDFNNTNGSKAFGNLIEVALNFSSFTTSQTIFTAPPFNPSFTNTSSGYTNYTWNFGDGNMSNQLNPTHTYQYNGSYTVTLFATDTMSNTTDTVSTVISCSGGASNPCNFIAELTQPQSSAIICVGDSFRLSATPNNSVTYAWAYNGAIIPNATDSIFYAKNQGFYMAVLSNASCSQVTSNYFVLSNYTATTPIISIIGSISPCSNDSLMLEASAGFTTYNWSNGKTGQSIYTSTSGRFIVEAYDNNTCINTSAETIINVSLADAPKICAVSVDDNSNHIIVKWQAVTTQKIDSFRVYRESSITNIYDYIGGVAYSASLEFEDMNSNVGVRQYAYKITAIDTCGKETPVSLKHKTMHLMINEATNNHWNLIWRPYEGFSFGSYKIYRGTDSTNMTLLTTISSNNTSYTDLTNPSGNVFYQLEVVSNDPCGAKVNGISRSNIFNTKNASGLGIGSASVNGISMLLFPNPNNGNFTLEINSTSNKTQDYQLEVYSVMGKLIHQEKLSGNANIKKQMHFETLSKGVYFVRLRSEDGVLTARFVVE
ncbi:MAG: T9SS type A sorting domain-containing protein [Bacteroidales bacterium]|nr:T9SS type A sorting domain-containing protein [Bacteroidales bacterium]